jgi:N-methylhydantoinase A
VSVEQAAWGIHQIANENMANAARVHVLERGKDPHRLPLFAFGGAGPAHAYRIALSLGMSALLLPFGAGVMSTVGFLSAPLAFDFVRSWRAQLREMDWTKANALLDAMEDEGRALLEASGVPGEAISHRREADMRYVGQGHEIRVPLAAGSLGPDHASALQAAFEAVYRDLYERLGPAVPLEILNWRVVSSGPRPSVTLRIDGPAVTSATASIAQARKGERAAYFPEVGGFIATPIYDRYQLAPGMAFDGPAIVEERESTAIIGPDAHCRIDAQHNLVVEL